MFGFTLHPLTENPHRAELGLLFLAGVIFCPSQDQKWLEMDAAKFPVPGKEDLYWEDEK